MFRIEVGTQLGTGWSEVHRTNDRQEADTLACYWWKVHPAKRARVIDKNGTELYRKEG